MPGRVLDGRSELERRRWWWIDYYRLPTEAEWEHACRAGTDAPRYGELDDIGWYVGNSESRAHAVGTKRPNVWGLYEMLGNVWEWCWNFLGHGHGRRNELSVLLRRDADEIAKARSKGGG